MALTQWNRLEQVREIDLDLMKRGQQPDRRWYVNSLGQTLAIIDGPVEFLMGSPASEPHHSDSEKLHDESSRRFAIATKEVSIEQFEEFLREQPGAALSEGPRVQPFPPGSGKQAKLVCRRGLLQLAERAGESVAML